MLFSNSSDAEANVVGNAAPVQDRVTGRIWLPFCRNNEQVFITFSDDDGLTWAAPTHHPLLTNPLWKWVGLGPPAGLQLGEQRMYMYMYYIYVGLCNLQLIRCLFVRPSSRLGAAADPFVPHGAGEGRRTALQRPHPLQVRPLPCPLPSCAPASP